MVAVRLRDDGDAAEVGRAPAGRGGEELGERNPAARRRWILDPIDGTKSFVRGVPLWGTLVAVAEGETVLAGAIHCPAAGEGELVSAARGAGWWRNRERCRV